jgi:hypothetical protein
LVGGREGKQKTEFRSYGIGSEASSEIEVVSSTPWPELAKKA